MAFEVGDRVKRVGFEYTYVVQGFLPTRYVDMRATEVDGELVTETVPIVWPGIIHEQWVDAGLGEAHWTLVDPKELSPA